MPSPSKIRDLKESILNSYSQVFFSTNPVLAVILLIISFFDPTAGISGLLAVFAGIVLTNWIGIDKKSIKEGLYGFNNLLVGLGLGINFQLSYELLFIVIVSSVLTTFITFSCIGLLTKYNLPYLSLPFLLALWISLLATSKFSVLGLSVRDIYTQNEITEIGGLKLLQFFQSVDNLIPTVIAGYFKSLGAIFFQFNVLSGIFISIGLLIFSRIVFSLSILGYLMALIIYLIFGIDMESLNYSYIGFNYILSTIAIGAYFFQPSGSSYLASLSVLPMVILLAFAAEIILTPYKLCVYSLPFILIVYLFLYALRFRTHRSRYLNEVYIHQSTPEKNAYLQINQVNKIRSTGIQSISLPVIGQWFINQGYNGDITHQGDWRHGLDFVIVNEKNIEFQNKGD
ncbi:MAG: urea transporter, partial [Prolixibacteraceae bacterium]|nr:urea transporter [Prolixibacteraceae bacterium]